MSNDPTATLPVYASTDQEFSVEEVSTLQQAEQAAIGDLSDSTSMQASSQALPIPVPLPIPSPLPLLRRNVSGRYQSPAAGFQLELRVDVDGTRPMKRMSGDFFQISGAVKNYYGSFIVNSPSITVTSTQVKIRGLGTYTFTAGAPVIEVIIPRRSILQPPAPASVKFFTTAGSPGASYLCAYESRYFRSVRIETDRVADVGTPVFSAYNTSALPSPVPGKTISVVSAFGEAGIEMTPTAASDVIPMGASGTNQKWSDSELHASMERHFSLWRDIPQWAVWEVVCQEHDLGAGLLGIMFDQQGKQRQGCAVFHKGLGGTTADKLRLQLYTYVHELGHCFNLLHSWQKSLATPPQANRPLSLSWMNYPWAYPGGGASAFWSAFPFVFDDPEIIHLRHGFRNNVITGGNNFAICSSLQNTEFLGDPIEDNSGLRLDISVDGGVALGQPVVVNLKLSSNDYRGKSVHPYLHPRSGLVQIAIKKPNGEVKLFEPVVEHCVAADIRRLGDGEVIEDSAFIGYGKDGFTFGAPGSYRIRALYHAIDGSTVLSNELALRVRHPVTAGEEDQADLMMGGDEQGTLLALLGSDAEELARGNAAFDLVLDKYSTSVMAQYVKLLKGVNASRDFKTIRPAVIAEDRDRMTVRRRDDALAQSMLSAVTQGAVIDPVTRQMAGACIGIASATSGQTVRKLSNAVRDKEKVGAAR
jgi:hypothetical protein